MTYVSRPVRAIRDEPDPGESVTLLLRLADADAERVGASVESLGGEVDAELAFETLRAIVPEESVADLCELDGLDAVETAGTLDAGDAGEDVELNDS
ncbi:hypothetical protein [Haladaptatus salinisoli]|uniref:hypothetical protein n=1 Tax=Haladaptatus salinisoli TaxID=2884876 RepID=UPI001D0B3721|nr:hypothetical protein [Haladaptatus salinisoli]